MKTELIQKIEQQLESAKNDFISLKLLKARIELIKVEEGDLAVHPVFGTCLVGKISLKRNDSNDIKNNTNGIFYDIVANVVCTEGSRFGRGFKEEEVQAIDLLPSNEAADLLYEIK